MFICGWEGKLRLKLGLGVPRPWGNLTMVQAVSTRLDLTNTDAATNNSQRQRQRQRQRRPTVPDPGQPFGGLAQSRVDNITVEGHIELAIE